MKTFYTTASLDLRHTRVFIFVHLSGFQKSFTFLIRLLRKPIFLLLGFGYKWVGAIIAAFNAQLVVLSMSFFAFFVNIIVLNIVLTIRVESNAPLSMYITFDWEA